MRALTLALVLGTTLAVAQAPQPATQVAPAPIVQVKPRVSVLTTKGEIIIELHNDKAPLSSENFIKYANDGFYNGTIFHRVKKGFMIQGGGYNSVPQLKPTRAAIKNEGGNGLQNRRGTVAMARQAAADSATSQFFINVVDNNYLNYQGPNNPGYAVFGTVVQGMDIVDQIAGAATFAKDAEFTDFPRDPVVIQKVNVLKPEPVLPTSR
jgi:cyclophilin family peptidyl-prolyl cis-trans isomerase